MKYRDWLCEWLALYVKPTLKERTYGKYRTQIYNHILPALGAYELNELSARVLQKFAAKLIESKYATNTVNGVISTLKSSLKRAAALGITDVQFSDAIVRPKTKEKQIDSFTKSEQLKIESYIADSKKDHLFGITLCLYTGLRIGELLALTWQDVDLAKGVLSITKSCHDCWKNGKYEKITETPKTENSKRYIPLPKALLVKLKALRKRSACEYVVYVRNKAYGAEVRSYQKTFERLLEKIDIPHKEIDFTDKDGLDSLGIKIPSGYSFVVDRSGGDVKLISYASSIALDWQKHYKFDITGDFSKATPIQVHLIKDDSIPVLLQYWDRLKQNKDESFTQIEDASQMLLIKKGSVIDFNDASTLAAAGIEMPDPSAYKYIAAHCNVPRWWHDANHYFQDRYNVPTDPVVAIAVLDVYVAPVAMRKGIEAMFNSLNGTAVTVKATENASGLPSFVFNGVTCAFSADGKITFTLAELRRMFGNNSYNSFEVGIKNGDSIITVGRTAANVNGSVVITDTITVDYFKVYQGNTSSSTGYCLANPKMQLYIKAWGIFAG